MAKGKGARARRPVPKSPGKIKKKEPEREPEDGVRFSFRYLDLKHEKFDIGKTPPAYFSKVLERLKSLSSMRASEILNNRSPALRAHLIDWAETSVPDGFSHLNVQLRGWPAHQFQITSNAYGRVHGFFIDNDNNDVFFVVWLDPDHNLYS